jgi:undecaprenyl diphosphate synthase
MKEIFEVAKPGEVDWDLASALDPERIPRHVAIIMDGNGRWAGKRRLPRVAGHKAGISSVRESVDTCARLGVQWLTLYAFSLENWKRPKAEVETLWRLLRVYLRKEVPSLMENGIRLHAIGRLDLLPGMVRRDLEMAIYETRNGHRMQLNLAINYGGRAEIADAVNTLIAKAKAEGRLDSLVIDEAAIEQALYTTGQADPDLLIRTSGEMRLSNFLLWQIAYAELYVTETLWPDFRRRDLLRAVAEFQKRDRRFGGLSETPEPALVSAAAQ